MLQGLVRRLQGVRLTRRSLIRMAVAILGSFVLISGIVTIVFPPPLTDRAFRVAQRQGPGEAERFLISALRERPEDADGWITLARLRSSVLRSDAAVPPEVILPDGLEFDPEKLPRRSGSSTELRPAEFDAFLATSPVVPIEILRAYRDQQDLPAALAHLAPIGDRIEAQLVAGDLSLAAGQLFTALESYERARAIDPESFEATTSWFRVLDTLGRDVEVEAAIADPAIRPAIAPRAVADHYLEARDYVRGMPPLWRSEYANYGFSIWLTCLVVAACWGILCFHLGFGWLWRRPIQLLAPLAFILGWGSADLTLAAVVITDDWVGKGTHSGVSFSLLYSPLIGTREELVKLLLFVPLVPYLVRMATDTQAIVLAGLVGLGFAANENANYYLSSGGGDILGRYITANFLHLALTGYAGYYLVRAARSKGEAWGEFFGALAQVIVFHAAYDLFLIEPSLNDYSIVSMILFILLSQRFLRLVFHVRPHRIHRVSLTRIFVAALATATGMHYLYLSTRLGIGAAIWQTLGGVLGIAILTFMYFQEFDEHVA